MLPDPMTLLVLVLVCYRLARILPSDTIAQPARDWLELRAFPPRPTARTRWWVFLQELTSCQLCLSLWVAVPETLVWCAYDGWPGWAVLWWIAAVWGGSTALSLAVE